MKNINFVQIRPWWNSWGYTDNPLENIPLQADDQGLRLLIGRDKELEDLCAHLVKPGKICCVEGHIGVGKTSLVNTAAYWCFTQFDPKKNTPLIIPCDRIFEFKKDQTATEFVHTVHIAVVQTLIKAAKKIPSVGLDLENWEDVNRQLNDPLSKTGGLSVAGSGVNMGKAFNSSHIYASEGLSQILKNWLLRLFPTKTHGSVVCIIDNLEVLQSSLVAQKLLEELRDRLFNEHGLHWVVCGADGIVNSSVASPRLSGYLAKPIVEVSTLRSNSLGELLNSRINEFKNHSIPNHYLPFTEQSFKDLYTVLNFNLRDTLSMAENFCTTVHMGKVNLSPNASDTEKEAQFDLWIVTESKKVHDEIGKALPLKAWSVLDTAMSNELQGSFGLGDYKVFRGNSKTPFPEEEDFKLLLTRMEIKGLISRRYGDDDEDDVVGRTLYSVTGKGSLAHFYRQETETTQSLADSSWLKRANRDK
jgi:hypothetical protein